jgi:hypothetical protein
MDAREQREQHIALLRASYLKIAQMVVQSRVTIDGAMCTEEEINSLYGRKGSFNLRGGLRRTLKDALQQFSDTISEVEILSDLSFSIGISKVAHGETVAKREDILECWVVRLDTRQRADATRADVAGTYKRLCVCMRTIYSALRLVPGHKLSKLAVTAKPSMHLQPHFNIGYSIEKGVLAHDTQLDVGQCLTPFGALKVSMYVSSLCDKLPAGVPIPSAEIKELQNFSSDASASPFGGATFNGYAVSSEKRSSSIDVQKHWQNSSEAVAAGTRASSAPGHLPTGLGAASGGATYGRVSPTFPREDLHTPKASVSALTHALQQPQQPSVPMRRDRAASPTASDEEVMWGALHLFACGLHRSVYSCLLNFRLARRLLHAATARATGRTLRCLRDDTASGCDATL